MKLTLCIDIDMQRWDGERDQACIEAEADYKKGLDSLARMYTERGLCTFDEYMECLKELGDKMQREHGVLVIRNAEKIKVNSKTYKK